MIYRVHEFALMESVVALAERVARENGIVKIERVTLQVGVLSGISVDALRFAFDAFKAAGEFDCAAMEIGTAYADGRCKECGARFCVDAFLPTCAACGSSDVEVSGGAEFTMSELEGE